MEFNFLQVKNNIFKIWHKKKAMKNSSPSYIRMFIDYSLAPL